MSTSSRMVVVGQFAGSHGVRGAFKVRSFTETPADIAAYGPLTTADGASLTVSVVREVKPGLFLCTSPEITSPEACEPYRGAKLMIARDKLPVTEDDEFYLDDLIGLEAETIEGDKAGKVKAVVNYGAGDIVELMQVPDRKGVVLVPFTKAAVPVVDLAHGKIVVDLPEDDQDAVPEPTEQ